MITQLILQTNLNCFFLYVTPENVLMLFTTHIFCGYNVDVDTNIAVIAQEIIHTT